MASGKKTNKKTAPKKPADKTNGLANALSVATVKRTGQFFRAGFRFTSEARTLMLADLEAAQITALEEEPKLTVEYVLVDEAAEQTSSEEAAS